MSSSLPVPSRIALTALRGLLVGTGCTLVLITEDRRRRIQAASKIIRDAKRLKSSQSYHVGGVAFALALEEDALLDPAHTLPPVQHGARSIDHHRKNRPHHPGAKLSSADSEAHQRQIAMSDAIVLPQCDLDRSILADPLPRILPNLKAPGPSIRPLQDQDSRPVLTTAMGWNQASTSSAKVVESTAQYAFPHIDEILSRTEGAAATSNVEELDLVGQLLAQAMTAESRIPDFDQKLAQAFALFCGACCEAAHFEAAGEKLYRFIARRSISRKPITEDEYYQCRPLEIIEGLLSTLDAANLKKSTVGRRMTIATSLYLPQLAAQPSVASAAAFEIGQSLLRHCFIAGRAHLLRIKDIFDRCLLHKPTDFRFAQWFMEQLHKDGMHKSVVQVFITSYPTTSPSKESLFEVVDVVVASVIAARNFGAMQALRTLLNLRPSTCLLPAAWVMKLLNCFWERCKDMEKTEGFVDNILPLGLLKAVDHPDGVLRVMIDIALTGDRPDLAKTYLEMVLSLDPALKIDARTLGVIATDIARQGDWNGVEEIFKRMKLDSEKTAAAVGRTFVPIIQSFAESHTVSETEGFLRHYVDHFNIPINSYMVTFMAKQYSTLRNNTAFIQWLEYCTTSGFKVDAAVSNVILTHCRRILHFPFRDLRTVFRMLRRLNTDFADRSTELIMANSALTDGKSRGLAKYQMMCLRPDLGPPPPSVSYSDYEMVVKMKEALAFRRPSHCLRLYKKYYNHDNTTRYSSSALCLAVQASLVINYPNLREAYKLIAKATKGGHDVTLAMSPLVAAKLTLLGGKRQKKDRWEELSAVLQWLRGMDIKISETIFNYVANYCLRNGNVRGALHFAVLAAKSSNNAETCYNKYNFSNVLRAAAQLGDLETCRSAITRAKASDYWTDLLCLKVMKSIRYGLRNAKTKRPSEELMQLLNSGIEDAIRARVEAAAERKWFTRQVIRIMEEAARGASSEPEKSKDDDGLPSQGEIARDVDWRLANVGLADSEAMESLERVCVTIRE